MPALQILSLSRTRIKVLPRSLFKLFNLKRLFLSHCDLLISLPNRVGDLKRLEVLDLEGTEIMNLPKEVEQLMNLTCLRVSFCELMNNGRSSNQLHEVIPCGIISTLSQLKELSIDVSPDDQRWNTNAEAVVSEVCGLAKLCILKFYFPRVELLSHFSWYSVQRACFRFTVGHHVRRIITEIPRDAESELERHDKCLRYVNGLGINMDIKKVLRHATAFFLDRHTRVNILSEFGFENMNDLKCCVVGECNELQAIHDGDLAETATGDAVVGFQSLKYLCMYNMKNLKRIWKGPLHIGLSSLKYLTLRACPQLTTVFTLALLVNLCCLEELTLDDCPAIISLVSDDDPEALTAEFIPSLKKIKLHYLPELVSFSDHFNILQTVEWLSIYYCPRLKTLPVSKSLNANLKEIKAETSWWEALKWESTEAHSWDDIFVPMDQCV